MPLQPSQKKRVTLWVAVGGTMAVIVTLWALQLPSQMARMRTQSQGPVSRWIPSDGPQAEEEKPKTLQEVIAEQREQISDLEDLQRAVDEQEKTSPQPE